MLSLSMNAVLTTGEVRMPLLHHSCGVDRVPRDILRFCKDQIGDFVQKIKHNNVNSRINS